MTIKGVWTQSLAAVSNALLSVVLLLVLASKLGPLEFGNYSVLLNMGIIGVVLIEGGYSTLIYREIASTSHHMTHWRSQFSALAVAHGLSATVCLLLLPIFLLFGQSFWGWWALLVSMLLLAWMNLHSGYLRGQGLFAQEALWQIAGRVVPMVAILVALFSGWASAASIFLAWSFGLVLILLFSPSRRPPWPSFQKAWPVRSTAAHLMIGQLLVVALMRVDLLALAMMGSAALETGYYTAAARFSEAGLLLFAPAVNVMQLGFRQRASDPVRFRQFLLQMGLAAIVLALVGMLVGASAAQWLIDLAFGAAYVDAAPLLVWVVGALVFVLPSQVLTQAAIALNRERTVWVAYGIGLLLALLALAVLVPQRGAMGAAWAMLVGHGCVFAMLAYSFRGSLR